MILTNNDFNGHLEEKKIADISEEVDSNYGMFFTTVNREDLKELINGKILLVNIDFEYMLALKYDPGMDGD